jgi:IS1 family transposase
MFNEGVDFGNFDITSLQQLLTQVAIRFDNDPNYYNKQDYQYLIWYLCKSLIYLENNDVTKEDFDKLKECFAQLENNVVFKDQFDLIEQDVRALQEAVKNLEKDNVKIKEELKYASVLN